MNIHISTYIKFIKSNIFKGENKNSMFKTGAEKDAHS